MKTFASLVFMTACSFFSFKLSGQVSSAILQDQFIYDTASFPSCHASTIVETPGGLVAAWFGGTNEGNPDVCIYMSRYNKGKWTAPRMIADGWINEKTRYACYNPVLYQVPGGELILFYKIGPNVQGWTGWIKRSNDHGETWSAAEQMPDGILGPIKNKPVLRDGLLICPSSTENKGWRVHFEYTRDFGHSWTKSEVLNDGKTLSGIQPSILEHGNSKLQAICRSMDGVLNETWSYDNGRTWTMLQPTVIPNNNSGIDAATLKSGRHILVYNHVKSAKGEWGPRSPINLAVSDDGKLWYSSLVLYDEKGAEFSYPYVLQTSDGLVHIVYTWKRKKIRHVVIDPEKLVKGVRIT
ncbi:MAG TPA: sialidase family protein [Chitinophagaceae bacterium]|nr:sialidase family protein [Chitinophagaceae bacterium]